MPRGRIGKTPKEAKEDSLRDILRALQGKSEGKRFKDLKDETGFHQSTLSSRLKELIMNGSVERDPINRLYRISKGGTDDLETRQLRDIMEVSSRLILGSRGGGSIDPAEDLIIKSSVAYSYPAIRGSILGYLKRIVHKYFMFYVIHELARGHDVDSSVLYFDESLVGLVEQIKKNLEQKQQVLAFKFDLVEISNLINVDYLKEIARISRLEEEVALAG
jgi:DNA-binding Lrp family transcriptional regulator